MSIGKGLEGPGIAAQLQVAHKLVLHLAGALAGHDADFGAVGVLGQEAIDQAKDLVHGASVEI